MTVSETDFVVAELGRRVDSRGAGRLDDFAFMSDVNDVLATSDLERYPECVKCPPTIWVTGLPRSGTTILMQLLCGCLDLGYTTNVAARFWRAPLCGIRLSRILLGERRDRTWKSDYGKSVVLEGPHEYSYFWHWLLKMESMPPYDVSRASRHIDWSFVRRVLMNMNLVFGRPVIHKAMAPTYHLQRFADLMPDAIFVHITRDPIDVAASLANARLHYYGDLSAWWSLYTEDYETLRSQPFWRQIARQIRYIDELQTAVLSRLDNSRVYRISYSKLCADPRAVIEGVADCLRDWSGVQVANIGDPPNMFQESAPKFDQQIHKALRRGLAEIGLPEKIA